MRLTRSPWRPAALAVAAAGLLAGILLAPSSAQGAPALTADRALALSDSLGPESAGTYLDSTGALVVTVTNAGAAAKVRAAGAVPRLVDRGAAELAKVTDSLGRWASIPGTAWAVDPISNQVVVSVDSTVTGAKLDQVKAVVDRHGTAARLETVAGAFSPFINGGSAIYTSSSRCSLGFNVRNSSGTRFFLTAGHCTNIGATWYGNSSRTQVLGSRAGSSFPGNDYGIVRYTNTSVSNPGSVNLYNGSSQDITTAANAVVGQSVRRSGSTTGVRSGSVTATNATVNYPQGTVTGLIRTNVCAEPGDSGGSLFAGSTALGLTSGGSGNCTFGGTTFFQPVVEALNVFGVNVY